MNALRRMVWVVPFFYFYLQLNNGPIVAVSPAFPTLANCILNAQSIYVRMFPDYALPVGCVNSATGVPFIVPNPTPTP